jgi:hypothetical protein
MQSLDRTATPPTTRRKPRARTVIGALIAAAVAVLALVAPATSASASTTPTVAAAVSGSGNGTASVTINAGGLLVAYVSADGPANSAVTATVKAGTTSWPLKTAASYQQDQLAPGYAGAFSLGTNQSAASRTVTVTLGSKSKFQVWLRVEAYSNASGLGQLQANGLNTGCPQVPYIAAVGGNSLEVAVGHNWSSAATPVPWTGNPPTHITDSLLNATTGDGFWTQTLNSPTTSEEMGSLALSSPCGTVPGDNFSNMAKVEILPAA